MVKVKLLILKEQLQNGGTMNKESRYDNITGEWNPAEWEENVNNFYCYPPSRYEDNENFINYYRNQDPAEIPATRHTVDIGKGHHMFGDIDVAGHESGDLVPYAYYNIHGISKTLEDAQKESFRYNDYFHKKFGDTPHYQTGDQFTNDVGYHHSSVNDDGGTNTSFLASPIKNKSGDTIGYSWVQDHQIIGSKFSDHGLIKAKQSIEQAHKDLYDMNNPKNPKLATYHENNEWEPEEWSQEDIEHSIWNGNPGELHTYPATEHEKIDYDDPKVRESPSFGYKTTNIGRGHLFNAHIEYNPSDPEWTDVPLSIVRSNYSIHGIAKTKEEALQEAGRYRQHFFHNSGYPHHFDAPDLKFEDWSKKDSNAYHHVYTTEPEGHGYIWLNISSVHDPSGKIIGHKWTQEHTFDDLHYGGRENERYGLDCAKKDIEDIHKQLHDMNAQDNGKEKKNTSNPFLSYKQAHYNITGEWEPEEWHEENGLSYYPPPSGHISDVEHEEPTPHPELSTVNIGRGHLFTATIDHSTNFVEGYCTVFVKSKSIEDAQAESSRYSDAFYRMTRTSKPTWNSETSSRLHIGHIKNNSGDVIGYNWAQDFGIYPLDADKKDHVKNIIESTHKYFHDMNNNGGKQAFASYDQITGEWEPEEFGTHYEDTSDRDQLHYPPLLHKTYSERLDSEGKNKDSWDKAFRNFYPHPDQGSISIGNGHQLQSTIWRDHKNGTHVEYRVHGIARTEEEANAQADKYLDYHKNKLNIGPEDIHRRDYETDDDAGYYTFSNFYDTTNSGYPDCIGKPLHAERYIKPLTGNDGKIVGYSWEQNHHIPTSNYKLLNRDDAMKLAQLYILTIHKDLHDMNNPQTPKFAKVYTTDIDEEGYYITKVADRMSPEELGPEFSGTDQQEQNLDGTVDNQPREVSETIPSSNSFFTHDTLASITASYDNITGEWEPEEWNTDGDCSFYPPYRHDLVEYYNMPEHEFAKSRNAPDINKLTIGIGKGHQFAATAFDRASDMNYIGSFQTYGISHTPEEAYSHIKNYHNYNLQKHNIDQSRISTNELSPDEYEDNAHSVRWGLDDFMHSGGKIKELKNDSDKTVGYSWNYWSLIPNVAKLHPYSDPTNTRRSRKHIEEIHKDLYDMNNQDRKPMFSYKTAEVEDMNYEGVGSLFGQGMGPQDFSINAADVEEGPKGHKSIDDSTVQRPGALQGQAVLPDVTSWFTASYHEDDGDTDEWGLTQDDHWQPL